MPPTLSWKEPRLGKPSSYVGITAIQTDDDENRPFRAGLPIIQVDAVPDTLTP